MPHLFSGNPLDDLEGYRGLTESTFLVDVGRWSDSDDPQLRELGPRVAAHSLPGSRLEDGGGAVLQLSHHVRRADDDFFRAGSRFEARPRSIARLKFGTRR